MRKNQLQFKLKTDDFLVKKNCVTRQVVNLFYFFKPQNEYVVSALKFQINFNLNKANIKRIMKRRKTKKKKRGKSQLKKKESID